MMKTSNDDVHDQKLDMKFDNTIKKSKSDDALVVFLHGLLLEKVELQSNNREHSPSSMISLYMDNFLDSSRTQRTRQPLHNRVCKTKSLPSNLGNYSCEHVSSSLVDNRWNNSSSSLDDYMIRHRRLNPMNEKNKYGLDLTQVRTRRDSAVSNRHVTNFIKAKQHRLKQAETRSAQRWRATSTLNDVFPSPPPQVLCCKSKDKTSFV